MLYMQRKAVVQHLYLGRNAPLFTGMRVLHQCPDDDHLVLSMISSLEFYGGRNYNIMHAGNGVGNEFSHSG